MEGEDLLRPRLVEAERECEGIAAGVGNSVELADRRHVRFAIHAVQPLGDVEDYVWSCSPEELGKVLVRLEANDFAEVSKSGRDRVDRLDAIPFRKEIGGVG